MRRQYNKSQSNNLYASKRIAVALCAAIAMVLGAMSVGAKKGEIPFVSAPPVENPGTIIANRSATAEAAEPDSATSGSSLSTNSLSTQQPVTPVQVTKPKKQTSSILVNPKKPKVDVTLGPIKALINKEKIEVNVNAPALAPLVEPLPVNTAVTVEVPSVEDTIEDVVDTVVPLLDPGLQSQSVPEAPAQ